MKKPFAVLTAAALLALPSVSIAAPYRYDHIVIVIEENTDYAQVLGDRVNAPYINELADGGVNFTEFYAITHPSQPNYIHLFSGDNHGVVDNNRPPGNPWTTPNLGASLIAAGRTFRGYSEDLPFIGDSETTGTNTAGGLTLYRRKHNPWANWQAPEGTDPIPANQLSFQINARFLDFPADFSQLPDVAIVVPNQQNDMHDGTVRMGDEWLRANLGAYAQWAKTHNSLLMVTFDEDNLSGPNKIPTVFYGAGLTPGTANATRWTLHNLLRTLEDMHGTAHAGRAAQLRPITGIFPNDPPVLSTRFRQGLNGYADCTDTMVRLSAPTTNSSAAALLSADTDALFARTDQILVRFENLFGSAPGQVPANATIISAKLSMWTGPGANDDSNDLASAHRMLIPWSGADTWDSLIGGVSANDVEAVAANTFTHMPELENAPVILDVTADVAAFLTGSTNHGWLLDCTGPDGWNTISAEGATTTQRPTLQIAYTLPVAPGYAAWQLGKFPATAGAAGTFPMDDPDADGAPNLVEYALNANPAIHSKAEQLIVSGSTTVQFTRNLDATDLTLEIEATSDLASIPFAPVATWTQAAGWSSIPGTSVTETGGAVKLTAPSASTRFFRARATVLP